jgi:glycosyltransferase involved in cell wall biosynthesis
MSFSLPQEPWRLAFVITELEVGGAERCLTNLVLGLDRRRFTPIVYSLWPRPKAEQCELIEKLESADVPVHFVGLRLPRHFRKGSRQLNRLLSQSRPHLLQSFLFHANVIGAISGWRTKVPHIVQGIRVADRSAWRMMLERATSTLVERIVCVSDSVARMARDEARLPSHKLCVIPNGIDVESYENIVPADLTTFGIPPGRRVLVCVGRLHRQKGIDWLLKNAPAILQEFSDVDFLIVGQGPEEEALKTLAAQLEISQRVHFVGWRPDVPAILKSCSLLLLPSRWEGMPNALLEAMALQLPVVASRVEGVTELLGPRADEQVVPFGGDQNWVDTVASILRDAPRARELGVQNHARILEEFSLRRMIAAYETLYSTLLEVASDERKVEKSGE